MSDGTILGEKIKYPLTVNAKNGTVKIMVSDENGNEVEVKDLKNIERGKTVKVIQKANTGYRFADIKAVDKVTNTPIAVSGNFTFTMMSPVELTVDFEEVTDKYTVTVNNGVDEAEVTEYSNREVATVTAGDVAGKKFSHWINTENGSIVSYDKTYAFIVLNNISLEAVFVEKAETVEKNPFVTMGELTTSVVSGKYRLSYNGQFFLPKDCTLKEYGMVLTPDTVSSADDIVINSSSIRTQKIIATAKNSVNQYVINVNGVKPNAVRSGRMYVIYTDSEGNEQTIYSNTYASTGVLPAI